MDAENEECWNCGSRHIGPCAAGAGDAIMLGVFVGYPFVTLGLGIALAVLR